VTAVAVVLVAAVAQNGVIGGNGAMPWRLSTDLRRFRRLTDGKPVIMGRKTFEAIGNPLAGRTNIVVSRSADFSPAGVLVAGSVDEAIAVGIREAVRSGVAEVSVIGGGEIYAAAIDKADRMYVTHVAASPEGDTFFPAIDPAQWRPVSSEPVPAGEKDTEATTFVVYERIRRKRA
jgi:dihydrofolate reductase